MLIAYFRHRDSHDDGEPYLMSGLAAIFAYHRLNGEINNCRELRERLQARNPSVLFRSDTGILRYAWRELTALFIKNER